MASVRTGGRGWVRRWQGSVSKLPCVLGLHHLQTTEFIPDPKSQQSPPGQEEIHGLAFRQPACNNITERNRKTRPEDRPLAHRLLFPPPWAPPPSTAVLGRGPHLWRRHTCLLGGPVGPRTEQDEQSTPTTFSHIKIEQFIQDTECDLLILSKQMGRDTQGDSFRQSA